MAEKTRFTRRDLKGPDEFISTFGRTIAWCKENRVKVAAGAIGVVAVVALALGTRAYLQWEENKSAQDLWPMLNRAQELLQAPFAADPSQMATVEQFLQGHVGRHPNTRATVYSLYYLGSIAFYRGNYDLAITQFRAGIATGKEAGILRYLLRQAIASSLEAKGDFEAAAAAYREAGGGRRGEHEDPVKAGRGARPRTCREKDRGGGAVPPDPQGNPGNPPAGPGRNPAGADRVTSRPGATHG